jgi:hypothetical protein
MKIVRAILIFAVAPWIDGCTSPNAKSPATQASTTAPTTQNLVSLDAPQAMQLVFHVDIFVVSVPTGTFSGNEPFWKRIDEQCVDVPTHELLYNNGIRVGLAPLSELGSFAKYMNDVAPVGKISMTASEIKDAQIEMNKDLHEQALFYFNRFDTLIGRTFDQCENLMNISFEPAPRKPGEVRLTLCPMVRATRKRLQFTQLNDSYEMTFVTPENYYDLNFRVDIPLDQFFIVCPSPKGASNSMTIGNAFFMKNGTADKMEQILIVIPHPMRVDQTASKSDAGH